MKRRERKRLTETRQVASLFRERERGVGGVGLSVGWRQSIVRFRLKCRQYLIDGRGSNRRYTDCSSKEGLILITGVCFMALRERRARNRIKSVFPRVCVCVCVCAYTRFLSSSTCRRSPLPRMLFNYGNNYAYG